MYVVAMGVSVLFVSRMESSQKHTERISMRHCSGLYTRGILLKRPQITTYHTVSTSNRTSRGKKQLVKVTQAVSAEYFYYYGSHNIQVVSGGKVVSGSKS